MIKRIIAMTATVIFIFVVGGSQNERKHDVFTGLRIEHSEEAEADETGHTGSTRPVESSGGKTGDGGIGVGGLLQYGGEVAESPYVNQGGLEIRADVSGVSGERGDEINGESGTGEKDGEPELGDAELEANGTSDIDGYLDGAEGSQPESESDTGEVELTYLGDWTITGYCGCAECNGVWADGRTAYGEIPTAGHTIACNVLPAYTQVMINDTVYTVEDTGSTPYGDEWIDIFFDEHEKALEWGVKVLPVYLLG